MRFILEHSLSPKLADALTALEGLEGHSFVHLRRLEGHPDAMPDAEWLPKLAREAADCIVITADPRITRGPHERAAWLEAGLTTFFLQSFADLIFAEQAWRLVKWWPEIVRRAVRARRGSGFIVTVNGQFNIVERRR